jgi:hypothetical protein
VFGSDVDYAQLITRLTNGFSKKAENHAAAVALYTLHYNFARQHKSLANPYPRTPAMAAGVADHIWTCGNRGARLNLSAAGYDLSRWTTFEASAQRPRPSETAG